MLDMHSVRFSPALQGFAGELDLDAALDFKRSPGKPAQRGGGGGGRFEPQSSKKRQAKDSKFGESLRLALPSVASLQTPIKAQCLIVPR